MRIRSLIPVAVALITAFALATPATAAELDLKAHMNHGPRFAQVAGQSEYDRDAWGREVDVELRGIGRLAGHRITVFVSGERVGTMLVTASGHANHEWDTEHGEFVPRTAVGDYVRVRAANGNLIAWGKYVRSPSD